MSSVRAPTLMKRSCVRDATSETDTSENPASEGASPLRQGRAPPSTRRGFAPRSDLGGCAPLTPISRGGYAPPHPPPPDGEV